MKATFLRLLSVALTLLAAGPLLAEPTPAPSPAASAAPTSAPTPAGLPLTEIAPQAQTKLNALNATEPEDSPDKTLEAARAAFRDLTIRADDLVTQSSKAAAPGTAASLDALRDSLGAWRKLQETLDDHIKALGDRGAVLEKEATETDDTLKLWNTTRDTVANDFGAPGETLKIVESVLTAADAARRRVAIRRSAVLSLQTTLNDVGTRIAAGVAKAQAANAEAVKTLLVPDTEPIWTAVGAPRPDFFARWSESAVAQWRQFQDFSRRHWEFYVFHAAVFGVVLAAMYWLRRRVEKWTEDEPHLVRAAPIFQVPVATAFVLSAVLKGNLYAGTPPLFRAAIGVVLVSAVIIVLRRLLDRRLGLVVYSLGGFYVLEALRMATAAFPATNRWIFCVELAVVIAVFARLNALQRAVHPQGGASLGRGIFALNAVAILALLGALGATVLGYLRLGALVGGAALFSASLAVGLYALLRVVEGLIVIVLRVRPATASRVVQIHRGMLQDRIYKVFRFAMIVLWGAITLDRLQVLDALYDWTTWVLAHRLPLGATTTVTPGSILAFALAVWASFLLSRLVRFFLEEEVYERVQLSAGLPYAISTMLNYTILIVGFLVAIGMLGVPLTQFTVVVGAFSVGLGFGLQNVINNFVSGIILLFERPIRVGDVVQIGDAVGEVRRIGIRASIVRTREGSDVILPNGNLISNQVTNWTYADRARTVEIPLNLATAPDYAPTLELLRATVKAQPGADRRPEPSVFITALTATGCTVVVRAWTDHYEDWMKVRSDLSAALAAALARENVKLA